MSDSQSYAEAVCIVKYEGNTIVIPLRAVRVGIHREFLRQRRGDGSQFLTLEGPMEVKIEGLTEGYTIVEGEPSDLLHREPPAPIPDPKEITDAS